MDKDFKDILGGLCVVIVLLFFLVTVSKCAQNDANQTTKRMELCIAAGKTYHYRNSCT